MLNSAEHEFCPANKSETTNNCNFFFLVKLSWARKFSLLIIWKCHIVGIFIFISRENFVLSWVEHEKKFYNLDLFCSFNRSKTPISQRNFVKLKWTPNFWRKWLWKAWVNVSRFSQNFVYALILWRSGLGSLIDKFRQFLIELFAHIFISRWWSLVNISGFSPNLVCALILWKSG